MSELTCAKLGLSVLLAGVVAEVLAGGTGAIGDADRSNSNEQRQLCEKVADVGVEMNRARKQGNPQRRVEAAALSSTVDVKVSSALVGVADVVYAMAEDNDSTVRAKLRRDCQKGFGGQ